jgi:recombination associated protein RdgC
MSNIKGPAIPEDTFEVSGHCCGVRFDHIGAEQVISCLRKALGTLPVSRADANVSPAMLMTEWVKAPATLPEGLGLGDRCELKGSGDDAASVRFTAFDLSQEEILNHIEAGLQVIKLNLSLRDEIEFDLTDNLQIKRLRPLDLIRENLDNIEGEDALAELMARISLQGDSLRQLLDVLGTTLTDVENGG